jgi:hypothetical protein
MISGELGKSTIGAARVVGRPARSLKLHGAGRLATLLTFAALMAVAASPSHGMDHNYRTSGDIGVYLGVVSAQIVRGHPASHPEQTMHGGVPGGRHQYHVLVAIFEQPSGARVTDAEVMAKVSGEGHVGVRELKLEPMTIADATTYGNYVALPGSDRYTIEVHVRRPGKGENSVTFSYRHGQE